MFRAARWLTLGLALAFVCQTAEAHAPAQQRMVLAGLPKASLNLRFVLGVLDGRITFARAAGPATDGLYTDAAGSTYNSYATNVPRFINGGLLIEEARTQSLLNTDAPATQTTASLGVGSDTLWVIGTGGATPSAVTATGCTGLARASAGVPVTFACTGAGTILVTVDGTLTRFQLEAGTYPTSYIPRVASAAVRAKDLVSVPTAGWLNATQGTLITEASWFGLTPGNTPRVVEIDDGTANNLIAHFVAAATGNIVSSGTAATVAQWNIASSAAWSAGKVFRMGTAYQTNVIDYALNGTLLTRDTVATIPTGLTTMHIGQDPTGVVVQSMLLRHIQSFPRPMLQADVQQATR